MIIFWKAKCFLLMVFVELQSSNVAAGSYTDITGHFFVNLKENYIGNYTTNKQNIQDELNMFKEFVKESYIRDKRQNLYQSSREEMDIFLSENKGVQKFSGLTKIDLIQLQAEVIDITIFTQIPKAHNFTNIYAAILQGSDYETWMSIHKYSFQENTWVLLHRQPLKSPHKIFSESTAEGTLLCVTHKTTFESDLNKDVAIFLLDHNIKINFVQKLETPYFNNAALWTFNAATFLTFSSDHIQDNNYRRIYEILSPVYIWRRHYFNFLQNIEVANAKSVITFQIGLESYLGFANHQNNYGERKIFSQLYKYNYHENKFFLYQSLSTNCAIKIMHFSQGKDNFVLVVNEEENLFRKYYATESTVIIYKYMGRQFIPFQQISSTGKSKWYKIEEMPDKLALLSRVDNGDVKIYQYTGWQFESISKDSININPSENFLSLKTESINGDLRIVMIDKNSVSIYNPAFQKSNDIKDIESNFSSWCDDVKKYVSCVGGSYNSKELHLKKISLLEKFRNIPSSNHENLIKEKIQLDGGVIGKIKTQKIISDDVYIDTSLIENLNNLQNILIIQESSIKVLKENIQNSLLPESSVIPLDSLNVNNLEVNNEFSQFGKTLMGKLNGVDFVNFQNEVYRGEMDNNLYDLVKFDELFINELFQYNTINSMPKEELPILKYAELNGLNVKGNVQFPLGLIVRDTVDDVYVSTETLLLSNGDQAFKGDFEIPLINSALLHVDNINDFTKESLLETISYINKTYDNKYRVKKLVANDIHIEGLINHLKEEKLWNDTLKWKGNQHFRSKISVSNLEAFDVSTANNKLSLVDHMMLIDKGIYVIDQDVRFNNLILDQVTISKRLNNIPVVKNDIKVLLLNSEQTQRVTGDKVFDFVELIGPLNLQGKINSPSLEKKNPVTMIEKPLILTGDFIIDGTVSIEKQLQVHDLIDIRKQNSVRELSKRSLRLTDRILMPVTFSKPLEVNHLQSNMINNIDPLSWVSKSNRENEINIRGVKSFQKNLHITGHCSVHSLNRINLQYLEDNLLKIFGDQIVHGHIAVQHVLVTSMHSPNVKIGNKSLDDIFITSRNDYIKGETVITNGGTVFHQLFTKSLGMGGSISGYNINYLLQDTVLLGSDPVHLYGVYTITESLNTQYLESKKTFGIKSDNYHLSNLFNGHLIVDNLEIHNPLFVRFVNFSFSINGISRNDFGSNLLLTEGDQIVDSIQNFRKLFVLNNVALKTGKVNDVSIQRVYEDAMLVTDNIDLNSAVFTNGLIVKGNIEVGGTLNSLNIPHDFILKSNSFEQHVTGIKTINNFNVHRFVNTELMNNVHIESLSQFLNSDIPFDLIIDGNLSLHHKINIQSIHGKDIDFLLNNIWFSDVPGHLTGRYSFKLINILNTLHGNISHKGIKLSNIVDDYLSLTKDQDIDAHLKLNNIIVDKANVDNLTTLKNIHGVNWNDFAKNALKATGDQVIDATLQFDLVSVNDDLNLQRSINNLNLSTDILLKQDLTDKHRRVSLHNLNVTNLILKDGLLQNIHIPSWINNFVRKDKNNGVVRGIKYVKNAELENISSSSYINNRKLTSDNVMTISGKENIQGHKTFVVSDNPLYMEDIQVENKR